LIHRIGNVEATAVSFAASAFFRGVLGLQTSESFKKSDANFLKGGERAWASSYPMMSSRPLE
jgi:hypothetical protein